VNVIELLADLQARHDETTARVGELRDQIEHLTAALAETEAHLADLATTRKVIAELAPAGVGEPEPAQANTTYQAIVNAFEQRPDQEFRARELHELLGMPTDEASVNVTRARLGRLVRQGFLTQPGRGRYQKRT
jgi:multidrug resistance efflux pump